MAAPLTLDSPSPASAGPDDDLVHAVCCDPDLAMCGLDASGMEWGATAADRICPVCEIAALNNLPCSNPTCPDRK